MIKKNKKLPPKNPDKWLVMRLGSLGDVVLCTGVLKYWHDKAGYSFTVLTKEAYASIFAGHPAVTNVMGLSEVELRADNYLSMVGVLAEVHHYEGLLDLQGNLRSRLLALAWQGTIKRYWKLGLERRLFLWSGQKWFKHTLRSLTVPQRYCLALDSKVVEKDKLRPKIYLEQEELAWAEQKTNAATVVLHPFATHVHKAWPEAYWQILVEHLVEQEIPYIIIGQSAVVPSWVKPEHSLVNMTGLRETCAILQNSACLITGDSGPMHLAEAVDCPVLAIFGPTTQEWGFFPSGESSRVLQVELECRPCSLHGSKPCTKGQQCLQDIKPELVMETLQLMLTEKPGLDQLAQA